MNDYIVDCSKLSNKDINWYHIILHLDEFDPEFEKDILNHNDKLNFVINKSTMHWYLIQMKDNTLLKNIFKSRLIECSKDPKSFFDKLTGNISFKSLNDCNKCHNDCILYLNQYYKKFLLNDDLVSIVDKLKILIYCEIRLIQLSKYLSIECLRIDNTDFSSIKYLIKTLDNNIIDTKEPKLIITGGGDSDLNFELDNLNYNLYDNNINDEEVNDIYSDINDEEVNDIYSDINDEDYDEQYKSIDLSLNNTFTPKCENFNIDNNTIQSKHIPFLIPQCEEHIKNIIKNRI
jgi:hypothetical protein